MKSIPYSEQSNEKLFQDVLDMHKYNLDTYKFE